MKILLYGLNFAPELTGIGRFSGDMAAWLAARGHEVRAVVAPPYYPAWRIEESYSGKLWRCETWKGVRVLRCPLYVPRRATAARRLLHLSSFAASSAGPAGAVALAWRPDVVFAVEPTAFVLPSALAAARLAGAMSWLHLQDFEFDMAIELGLLPHGLARPGSAVARFLMNRFAAVSTISPRMVERLKDKGVPPARAVLFPNWVDTRHVSPDADGLAFRRALAIPDAAVVALYSGNIGEKQGIEQIAGALRAVACARMPDDPPICFVLAGAGAAREAVELALRTQERDEAMVRLLPLQPEEKLPALLASADLHLLPQRPEAADLVMPSKLGGMLASGRPVVAAAAPGTQIARVIAGRGRVVPPGDGAAMGRAVVELARDPEIRRRLGASARAEAEAHWDREAVLGRFEAELLARVEARRGVR